MYSIEFDAHASPPRLRLLLATMGAIAVACFVALLSMLLVAGNQAPQRPPDARRQAQLGPLLPDRHVPGLPSIARHGRPHARRLARLTAVAVGATVGQLASDVVAQNHLWAPAPTQRPTLWPALRDTASHGLLALAALHVLYLVRSSDEPTPVPAPTSESAHDVTHQLQEAHAAHRAAPGPLPSLPLELWEQVASYNVGEQRARYSLARTSRTMFDSRPGMHIRYESILHQLFQAGGAGGNLTAANVVAQLDVYMRDFAGRGLTRAVHLKHLAERIPAVIHFHSVYAVLEVVLPLTTSQAALLDRLDRLIEAPTAEFLLRALAEVCLTRRSRAATRQCLDLLRARCAAANSTLKVPTTTEDDVDAAVAHLRFALDEQDRAFLPARYVELMGDRGHRDALACNVMHLMMQGLPAGVLVRQLVGQLPDRVKTGRFYFYMTPAAVEPRLQHFRCSLAGFVLELAHPLAFLDDMVRKSGLSLLVPDDQGLTPIKRAAFTDDVDVVRGLIEMDRQTLHEPAGLPAFLFAIQHARWRSAGAIVETMGSDAAWRIRAAPSHMEKDALLVACSAGVVDLFQRLSFAGEGVLSDWVIPDDHILSVDSDNHTCLHLAVYSGWKHREELTPIPIGRVEEMVGILCEKAVRLGVFMKLISVRTNNGRTALMGAIAAGLNSVIDIMFRGILHFAMDGQNVYAFEKVLALLGQDSPHRIASLVSQIGDCHNVATYDLLSLDPVWSGVVAKYYRED
ncbi:unnamed protein product (mitochondrion) [Plasmodiophora brassicae]|uniref:Uncharacterized protein n=1 Tax=Plasmodiophora brassicae TaxID=37360 RepID=A0A3P3YP49_PLABS|nr:unnamed protein product [Plasmodiophora brassicae]